MKKSVIDLTAVLLALCGLLDHRHSAAHAQAKREDRRTGRFPGVDFNVNVKQMNTMLKSARTNRDRTVKDLAKRILGEGVVKVTGAHKGGVGGGGRPADPEQHCTVETNRGNRYHVYLKEKKGRWSITKITGP
jgi:hypothetical protein